MYITAHQTLPLDGFFTFPYCTFFHLFQEAFETAVVMGIESVFYKHLTVPAERGVEKLVGGGAIKKKCRGCMSEMDRVRV